MTAPWPSGRCLPVRAILSLAFAVAVGLALPTGAWSEDGAAAPAWTEVRRVVLAPGERSTVDVDDDFRVTGDPSGAVVGVSGRRIEVLAPRSGVARVRVERAAKGALELVLAPRNVVTAPGDAGPSRVPATLPASPVSPVPVSPSPATASSPTLPPLVAPMPGAMVRAADPAPAVEPGSTMNAPGAFLASLLSPFMPVPPMSQLPAASGSPARTVAGAISAPPRPLVLVTPPSTRPSPPGPLSPPRHLVGLPGSGSAVAVVNEGPEVTEQAPAMRPDPGPPGGTMAFELPAPRGSSRPADTSLLSNITTKPGELAIFTLATDLEARGLWGDAIQQYRRLMNDYPATKLKEAALLHIGHSFKERAASMEVEAVRQFDLRRSGAANEAVDQAISDYTEAITAYRDLVKTFPHTLERNRVQLRIAQSLHGLIRTRFQKGGVPQDSPAVVVEYLRAFVGADDTELLAPARLGIAQYYRDLADARMLTRQDRVDVRRAYERAVSEYRSLIDSSPFSPSAEEALVDVARLYDRNLEMRHFDGAVKYYDELVRRFPTSRYADEARARSRWLRENYL